MVGERQRWLERERWVEREMFGERDGWRERWLEREMLERERWLEREREIHHPRGEERFYPFYRPRRPLGRVEL
jgi:hypothetical protein